MGSSPVGVVAAGRPLTRLEMLEIENRALRSALERIHERVGDAMSPDRDDMRLSVASELRDLTIWGLYFPHAAQEVRKREGGSMERLERLERLLDRWKTVLLSVPEVQAAWNQLIVDEANGPREPWKV